MELLEYSAEEVKRTPLTEAHVYHWPIATRYRTSVLEALADLDDKHLSTTANGRYQPISAFSLGPTNYTKCQTGQ